MKQTKKRTRAARWLKGSGIEIGALHHPLDVPPGVEVRYVDRARQDDLRLQYPELAGEEFVPVSIVGDAQNLAALPTDSVDFVIANHLLEHLEDPLRGMREMTRVLRPGGVLYLALPDPRVTFDRDRPLTTVEHLVDEYRHGTGATRERHYVEWVEQAEPRVEWMRQAGVATGPERVRELIDRDYSIHFHVWRPDTFLEFLVAAQRETGIELELLEFLACDRASDNEFIFVLRKGVGSAPPEVPPDPANDWSRRVDELEASWTAMTQQREQWVSEVARLQRERDEALAQSERLARARDNAIETIAAIQASPSWRLTGPLRQLKRAVHAVIPSARGTEPG